MVSDGAYVYVDVGDALIRIPVDAASAAEAEVLTSWTKASGSRLVLHAGSVYAGRCLSPPPCTLGVVIRVPEVGGVGENIAVAEGSFRMTLAVDDDFVYFAKSSSIHRTPR